MQRMCELFALLRTAWEIWRDGGSPADLEIAEYEAQWRSESEDVIVLTKRTEPENAVHFQDSRRWTH